jgi:hypothetical protein
MTELDKERAGRVGDPKLDAAYRALGAEEPPVAIDQAILAASRREAQSYPAPLVAPTGRRAWFVPLAAAAVLALAVGVTLHMQLEQPGIDGISTQTESAREAPAARAPAATKTPAGTPPLPDLARVETVAPKARTRKEAEAFPSTAQDRAVAENRVAAAAAAAAPPPTPAPAAAPAPRMEEAPALAKRADLGASSAAGQAAGTVAESPAPAAAAPAMRMMQRDRAAAEATKAERPALTLEQELERIADLRKQGRHDDADKALAEFRKRYPDFKIPEAMLERVERR